ncbi:MAG: hypothetical protein ACPIOQ_13325 [Promethearchaeia archaeon]
MLKASLYGTATAQDLKRALTRVMNHPEASVFVLRIYDIPFFFVLVLGGCAPSAGMMACAGSGMCLCLRAACSAKQRARTRTRARTHTPHTHTRTVADQELREGHFGCACPL